MSLVDQFLEENEELEQYTTTAAPTQKEEDPVDA